MNSPTLWLPLPGGKACACELPLANTVGFGAQYTCEHELVYEVRIMENREWWGRRADPGDVARTPGEDKISWDVAR